MIKKLFLCVLGLETIVAGTLLLEYVGTDKILMSIILTGMLMVLAGVVFIMEGLVNRYD